MYARTTIKRLIKRAGLAAFAIAMLLSLSALPAPTAAQGFAFDPTFRGGVFVGLARGQTVRLRIAATNNRGKLIIGVDDVKIGAGASALNGHVKVFDGRSGALLQSHELSGLTAGLHWIDINRDDLLVEGEPGTGRIRLWIEVVLASRPAGRGQAGVSVLPPTFEVMDNESGMTTVSGGLWKTTNFLTTDPVTGRPIVFTGLE